MLQNNSPMIWAWRECLYSANDLRGPLFAWTTEGACPARARLLARVP